VGLLFVLRAAVAVRPLLLLCGLVASYGLAWMGHFLVEKNNPATFRYPFWSLIGDLKMYGLMLRGKMAAEATRLGLEPPEGNAIGRLLS